MLTDVLSASSVRSPFDGGVSIIFSPRNLGAGSASNYFGECVSGRIYFNTIEGQFVHYELSQNSLNLLTDSVFKYIALFEPVSEKLLGQAMRPPE